MDARTENALQRFVRKTRALFASEADPERRWTALSPVFAELLADPAVIEASRSWPDCMPSDGRAENLLFYVDPDYGFAINGLTKATDQSGAPRIHHHAHLYTLYGVLDGHERMERYERLDDGTRADYAEIRRTVDSTVGPGEIDLVRPYEVHAEVTVGERTVAVIVRSEKAGSFNQGRFLPDEKRYYESLGPKQTPCEMLPPASV